jgi:hypothetical protein
MADDHAFRAAYGRNRPRSPRGAGPPGRDRMFEAATELEDGTKLIVRTSVAQHPGDIPNGTLRSIEKDMAPVFGEGWLK